MEKVTLNKGEAERVKMNITIQIKCTAQFHFMSKVDENQKKRKKENNNKKNKCRKNRERVRLVPKPCSMFVFH